MPGRVVTNRIRLGILALPVAGAMELATALAVWGVDTEADRDWARLVVSTRYEVAQFVDVLSIVLYLLGAFALYGYLAGTRAERWALVGLVLVVVYLVSNVILIASDVSIQPLVGRRYLEEGGDAFGIFREIEEEDVLPGYMDLTYGWSGYAAFVFFGVGIWRSGLLPQGVVILLAAFAVLTPISWAVSAELGFLGYLLVLVAETWVAWSVWWQLSAGEARSRVR